MLINLDKMASTNGHIFICNNEANIVINADLISRAGRIYILGKSVILNSNVNAQANDVKICGIECQKTAESVQIKGINVNLNGARFPALFMRGSPHH